MPDNKPNLTQLLTQLGYRPLNRTWAKVEILFGLLAVAIGQGFGTWQLTRPTAEMDWLLTIGALVLFVLGAYLTLAGHRSHLYQSSNELAALVLKAIQSQRGKE